MKCPNCGILDNDSRVIDTRRWKHTIRRRRECSKCGHRWSTYEAREIEFFSDRNRNKYLPWSPGEEQTAVIMHFNGMPKVQIAKELGRSRKSVSRKIDKLVASKEYFTIVQDYVNQNQKKGVINDSVKRRSVEWNNNMTLAKK